VWERGDTLARQHGDLEVLTWLQLPGVERDVVFGDAASARARARSSLESSEECATPQARMVAHVVLGIAHRLSDEWNEAVATLEEALLAATTGANRMFEGLVRAELAIAVLGQGDVDRTEREAQTSVDVAHESYSRCDEVRGSLALAQTQLIRANDPALLRVEAALGRAQELIHETGGRAQQPELHECRGRLAQLHGDLVAAELEIGLARSMYEEMGATEQVARLAAESSSQETGTEMQCGQCLPACEEVFFRGFLIGALRSSGALVAVAVVAAPALPPVSKMFLRPR